MIESTILVVDDDPYFLDVLKNILESADYMVFKAENGIKALEVLEEHTINLILADIAMPSMNGYQLFSRVIQHPQWVYIPFLFLSARDFDSDIQFGKELGADDYLIKPVKESDLLATIRGKLRRAKTRRVSRLNKLSTQQDQNKSDDIQFGSLKINLRKHRVWKSDDVVQLSALEFRLFAQLVQQPGCVVPHQKLVQATHGLDTDAQDASRLLRPLVRSVRRKLGYPTGDTGCIESLRGVGYQFNPPT